MQPLEDRGLGHSGQTHDQSLDLSAHCAQCAGILLETASAGDPPKAPASLDSHLLPTSNLPGLEDLPQNAHAKPHHGNMFLLKAY